MSPGMAPEPLGAAKRTTPSQVTVGCGRPAPAAA